jgi:hypothetical protein
VNLERGGIPYLCKTINQIDLKKENANNAHGGVAHVHPSKLFTIKIEYGPYDKNKVSTSRD